MLDSAAPYLFLCLLLFSFRAPYPLGLGAVRAEPNTHPIDGRALLTAHTYAPTHPPTHPQILLSEGMQLLWLFSECVAIARPATAKSLATQCVGLATRYTQNPRYGALSYVKLKRRQSASFYPETRGRGLINQPTNQPINQPTNRTIQPTNQPTNQTIPPAQSTYQPNQGARQVEGAVRGHARPLRRPRDRERALAHPPAADPQPEHRGDLDVLLLYADAMDARRPRRPGQGAYVKRSGLFFSLRLMTPPPPQTPYTQNTAAKDQGARRSPALPFAAPALPGPRRDALRGDPRLLPTRRAAAGPRGAAGAAGAAPPGASGAGVALLCHVIDVIVVASRFD